MLLQWLLTGPLFLKGTNGKTVHSMIKYFNGKYPAAGLFAQGYVDVQDSAECHLKALHCTPNIKVIIADKTIHSRLILSLFIKEFPTYPVNYKVVSYYTAKVGGWFDAEIRDCLRRWDVSYEIDNSLSIKEFGIKYHDALEAMTIGAKSLIALDELPTLKWR